MDARANEPTTYEAILVEGQLQGALEDIRCLGERRFRKPLPDNVRTILESIPDLQLLRQLMVRILEARNWDKLVTPSYL
jgi:hypothetical protein